MPSALALAVLLAAPPLPLAERVEGARAVERARYAFVIGATRPFDEVYPRAVFEKKVQRELAEERLLRASSGWWSRPASSQPSTSGSRRRPAPPTSGRRSRRRSGAPPRRSRRSSAVPSSWTAPCAPGLPSTRPSTRPSTSKARLAREAFLAGRAPPGTSACAYRAVASGADHEEMLARARADAAGPKVRPAGPEREGKPTARCGPRDGEGAGKGTEGQGDVTTILEESGRFSVFRLVRSDPSEWLVEAVAGPKRDFDRWFATVRGQARR